MKSKDDIFVLFITDLWEAAFTWVARPVTLLQ